MTSSSTTVHLVGLEPQHLERMRQWLQREELRELIGTLFPVSTGEHARWAERLHNDRTRTVLAAEDDEGRVVGAVGLSAIDYVYRNAEAWIYLGEDETRGRGLGQSAFDQLLQLAFHTLGLHRVYVTVFSYNDRAFRFFKAAGFRQEGVLREAVFKRGRFYDKYLLALLRQEYHAP